MQIHVLKSKIMYLVVTRSRENYEGSLGIPASIMRAAGLHEYEKVLVANRRTGARWETYAVPTDEGHVDALGIATHYVCEGDEILVLNWGLVPLGREWTPKIVHPVNNRCA